ncbi:MAG: NAD(P)-dependent oxidoreductase [Myxococcales bacterium]|nr:NAD(P)-dependent oxidoreductase [Myxococcales bacterium]
MRVLVTGASGYVGLHVVRRLVQEGHAVTALARTPSALGPLADHESVTVAQVDLEDDEGVRAALHGQDACIHAALIWEEPGSELDLRDTAASAKLFDAAGQAGLARVLYVSSTAVHRKARSRRQGLSHEAINEATPLAPTDVYGATKAASEPFLWAACAAHAMQGTVVRLGPVVGPPAFAGASFRSHARLEQLVGAARRGETLEIVRGSGRQFAGMGDAAHALCQLATTPGSAGTYLCVDQQVTTWESLARRVVASIGSSSPVVVVAPEPAQPSTWFDPSTLAEQLGVELDSRDDMQAHLAHLTHGP